MANTTKQAARFAAIMAVISCGIEQGMTASSFAADERKTVQLMARKGLVRIVGRDGMWILATKVAS